MASITEDDLAKCVPLPSNNDEDYSELLKALDNDEYTIAEEDKESIAIASLGNGLTYKESMLLTPDATEDDLDKTLTIRHAPVTAKGNTARGKKATYLIWYSCSCSHSITL